MNSVCLLFLVLFCFVKQSLLYEIAVSLIAINERRVEETGKGRGMNRMEEKKKITKVRLEFVKHVTMTIINSLRLRQKSFFKKFFFIGFILIFF